MPMAKVHPQALISSSSSSSSSTSVTPLPEVYTIWMKSLVMNSNGCTVYDSNGKIVYRVDNYDCKGSDEVYLMDCRGKTLLKILRKKLRIFGRWEGYRCNGGEDEEKKPWFRVRRGGCILNGEEGNSIRVRVGHGSENVTDQYKIEGMRAKSCYRIVDMNGGLVAEVKQKQTPSGIALGDDVLTLTVEHGIDLLLVMSLTMVCGLINSSM